MKRKVKIGTRGSKLALWQARFTQEKLAALDVDPELVIIKTQGDKIQHLSFDKMEGKGFFTKEIEEALLLGEVDMAVHSMKDMPTAAPPGLVITAVSYRADPADWLLIRREALAEGQLLRLKAEALVGTSSARRKSQMLDLRPDIRIRDIRGNVPTRLEKLRRGDFDAILLAAAGLSRLEPDLSNLKIIRFSPREFVPAPGQGVLAYQTCRDDLEIRRLLKHLHYAEVAQVTNVERKVLQLMEGGCRMPLGVYCEKDIENNFHVWAAVAESWNSPLKRVHLSSGTSFGLAEKVAEHLRR